MNSGGGEGEQNNYGTERMRQKLLVLGSGVLVKTRIPFASAGLVA
jgi:hypothetical protein